MWPTPRSTSMAARGMARHHALHGPQRGIAILLAGDQQGGRGDGFQRLAPVEGDQAGDGLAIGVFRHLGEQGLGARAASGPARLPRSSAGARGRDRPCWRRHRGGRAGRRGTRPAKVPSRLPKAGVVPDRIRPSRRSGSCGRTRAPPCRRSNGRAHRPCRGPFRRGRRPASGRGRQSRTRAQRRPAVAGQVPADALEGGLEPRHDRLEHARVGPDAGDEEMGVMKVHRPAGVDHHGAVEA
jgi:hypothetical protein